MKKDLQDKLYKKYPDIFAEKDWSNMDTCMCHGLCIGDGWYDIIDKLCKKIMLYAKDYAKPITRVTQVKQKFGRFVFYIHGSPKENYIDHNIDNFIKEAENEAAETCEICGSKEDAKMTDGPYLEVICKNCVEKHLIFPNEVFFN